jgi:eukaryotic-like serine/threonine-protein kinase
VTSEPHHSEAYCPTCDRSYDGVKVCPSDGTKLVDLSRPIDTMIGRTIDGRFTVRERLGAGGMGVVYRAWQASVGREVAIKVIAPRPGDDNNTAKRFLREAKLASQLAQPNIVMVIDFGATDDGTLYLAMELLRGRTLSQVTRAEGPFTPKRVLRIASQLCDALDSAHRGGIVHRDLKPANVMVLDEPAGRDFVKVLDFGLAKALDGSHDASLTQSDRIVGTPSYMAPEVITGGRADIRSDLYSVGVMLYEMLTGKLPYTAPNANVMLARHAYAPVPDVTGVPEQVAWVVKKLLAKAPEQRFPSASRLHQALELAVAGELAMDEPSDQALLVTAEQLEPPTISGLRRRISGEAETVESPVLTQRPEPATVESVVSRPAVPVAPPARSRRWVWILTILVAAALGAAAVVLASRANDDDTSQRGPSPSPSETVEPPKQMRQPAPPQPANIDLPDASVMPAEPPAPAKDVDEADGKKVPKKKRVRRPAAAQPGWLGTTPPDAQEPPKVPEKIEKKPDAGPTWVDPE